MPLAVGLFREVRAESNRLEVRAVTDLIGKAPAHCLGTGFN